MLQIPGHGHGMKISRDVNWGLRITLYLSNIDCLVYVFSVCQQELFCPILTTNSTNNRCHGQVPGPLTFYLLIFGAYNMYFVLLAYDLNPPSLHRQSLACSRHPPPKSVPVYLLLGSSWEELFTRNRKTENFHTNKLRTLIVRNLASFNGNFLRNEKVEVSKWKFQGINLDGIWTF